MGYSVLLPLIRQHHFSYGIRKARIVPLFAGYLFVARAADSAYGLGSLLSARGVHSIICIEGKPCSVPVDVIIDLQAHLDENGVLIVEDKLSKLKHGDRVKIIEGPFAGCEAVFDEGTPDSERVRILLNVLGRPTPTKIERVYLEPIGSHVQQRAFV